MSEQTDLATWLLACAQADEDQARAAISGQWDWEDGWGEDGKTVTPHVGMIHEDVQRAHVVAWNPARVLAECDTKRRIIELHQADTRPETEIVTDDAGGASAVRPTGRTEYSCRTCDQPLEGNQMWWPREGCATLRLQTLPFVDRDGYVEAWAPDGR
jgi:hypothetical protein